MQLTDVLTLTRTRSAVSCSSKKRALEIISEIAAEYSEHTAAELLESMRTREKVGTTGIGNGIAIPHGRVMNSDNAIAVLIQCQEPVDFDAIDNRPVDLLFALLVPDSQCDIHLKTLSLIAQKLNDKATIKQLRRAQSDEELFNIMVGSA